jgi:hypothetical protein
VASHTINGQAWPSGTLVSVYKGESQPAGQDTVPAGTAVTSATVSGSSVTFTGLEEGRRYLAYAAGVSKRFLVQPGSVDTLRPISGSEAQAIRDSVDGVGADVDLMRLPVEAGADITPATVAATFTAADADGKQGVLIPAGTGQKLTGTITVPDGMTLAYEAAPSYIYASARPVSYGNRLGRLVVDGTFSGTVAIQLGSNSRVRGLHLDGVGSSGVTAIRAYNSATWSLDYGLIVEDCHIESFSKGIDDGGPQTTFQAPNRISNTDISNCGTGIDLRKSGDVTIDRNCDIHDNTIGVFLQGTAMTAILGCRIEGNTTKGVQLSDSYRVLISGCRFDRNFEEAIYSTMSINGLAQQYEGFTRITGNIFSGNGTSLAQSTATPQTSRAIYFQRGRHVAIEGNTHFARAGQKNGEDPPKITPLKFAVMEDCRFGAVRGNSGTISHGVPTARITNWTVASPTVATAVAHGLTSGDRVAILADEPYATQPVVNGVHTVTVLSADTFSIPVNVTSVGSHGVTDYFKTGSFGTPIVTDPVDIIDTTLTSDIEVEGNDFTIAGDQGTRQSVAPDPKEQLLPNGDLEQWTGKTIGSAIAVTVPTAIADGFTARQVGTLGTFAATVTPKAFADGQTGVAGNPRYYAKYACTNAGSITQQYIDQRFPDARLFSGEHIVVSVWCRATDAADAAGTTIAAQMQFLQNFGTGGSTQVATAKSFTIPRGTTWVRVDVAITVPSVSGKTIATDGTAFTSVANLRASHDNLLQVVTAIIDDLQADGRLG